MAVFTEREAIENDAHSTQVRTGSRYRCSTEAGGVVGELRATTAGPLGGTLLSIGMPGSPESPCTRTRTSASMTTSANCWGSGRPRESRS
jgi:hypothetical protein